MSIKLKWRKVMDGYVSGPFHVYESPYNGPWKAEASDGWASLGWRTPLRAKRACEALASKILKAVKP